MAAIDDTDGAGPDRTDPEGASGGVARPLRELVHRLETDEALDHHADNLTTVSRPLEAGRLAALLRGDVIGHALHPAMTDLPLGCWTSASVLDLVGGRAARPAARRLIALGLLGSVPTALTGLAEFHTIRDAPARRVATVHAGGNAVVMVLQLMSWRARRRDHHIRGAAWALSGAAGSLITGYLGGHLLSALGEGIGARGVSASPGEVRPGDDDPDTRLLNSHDAASTLGVAEEQVAVMVAEGLLEPVERDASGADWFRPTDVEATRLLGG